MPHYSKFNTSFENLWENTQKLCALQRKIKVQRKEYSKYKKPKGKWPVWMTYLIKFLYYKTMMQYRIRILLWYIVHPFRFHIYNTSWNADQVLKYIVTREVERQF